MFRMIILFEDKEFEGILKAVPLEMTMYLKVSMSR